MDKFEGRIVASIKGEPDTGLVPRLALVKETRSSSLRIDTGEDEFGCEGFKGCAVP
jgi:hypothetical protein